MPADLGLLGHRWVRVRGSSCECVPHCAARHDALPGLRATSRRLCLPCLATPAVSVALPTQDSSHQSCTTVRTSRSHSIQRVPTIVVRFTLTRWSTRILTSITSSARRLAGQTRCLPSSSQVLLLSSSRSRRRRCIPRVDGRCLRCEERRWALAHLVLPCCS